MTKSKIISGQAVIFLFFIMLTGNVSFAESISGTVSDANGSTPIQGMWVDAYDYSTGELNSSAMTGSDGSYTISALLPGSYRVCIPDSTFLNYIGKYYNNTYDSASAVPVKITSGRSVSGINFSLEKGGQITGKMTDSAGSPIKGAGVSAYHYSEGYMASFAPTLSDGSYNIKLLHSGNYRVYADVSSANYLEEYYEDAYEYNSAAAVEVSAGQTASGTDFVLKSGEVLIKIGGTITATFSRAMEPGSVNADTFFVTAGNSYGLRTVTGNITYSGMTATFTPTETLNSNTAYKVTVTAGVKDITGISLQHDYTLVSAANSISGKVFDKESGVPVKGVKVTAENYSTGAYAGYAITQADGWYAIPGLSSGKYKINTQAFLNYSEQYYENTYDPSSATAVEVFSGQPTPGINFYLDEGEVAITAGNTDNPVIAVFSNPMLPSTVNTNTFFVVTGTSYNLETVSGGVSYSGRIAKFIPAEPFKKNTRYTVTVTTGAEDISGNPLQRDYEFIFTTAGITGDINGDNNVTLADAVLVLQLVAGAEPLSKVRKEADLDGDGRVGLEEVVYILGKVINLRN
ncbi:MAG: hypothetical protein GY749_17440 [Desulfobacteraceae bacterium]|nr:hypothetical protein [Desulfobacteraceae bacterium]